MKSRLSPVVLTICLSLSACSSSQTSSVGKHVGLPHAAAIPRIALTDHSNPHPYEPKDPMIAKAVDDLLLKSDMVKFKVDRIALVELRHSAGDVNHWPDCGKMARLYVGQVGQMTTLWGVKDLVSAAAADDAILCDTPTIMPALEAQMPAVFQQKAPTINASEASRYIMGHPSLKPLAHCWIEQLSVGRKKNTPPSDAYLAAEKICK